MKDMVIELIEHEGHGWYWLMDSYELGWLSSKTYKTKREAIDAMVNKVDWTEKEIRMVIDEVSK
jgi:hypothetical protein